MFLRLFTAAIAVIFLTPGSSAAQEKQQSYLRKVPSEIERDDPRVQAVIDRAEDYFRKGEMNLRDGKREAACRDFDEALDTILKSGMDVRSNHKLQNFYLQLVERFYRGMLVEKLRPARALQAAQVSMLKESRYRLPYYWAAFTLQGEWR